MLNCNEKIVISVIYQRQMIKNTFDEANKY